MWAASCLASCCAACACQACQSVVGGISRRSARIAYCGLFALSLIVSWILREVAAPLMEKLPSYFLNPKYHYSRNLFEDNSLKRAVHEVYDHLFPDCPGKDTFGSEIVKFRDAVEMFGCHPAVKSRNAMMPWINHFHQTPNREWFETDAVLRVSLGNFLFFTVLAVLMIGVRDQKDPRDRLHHGGWMMKVISWCLVVIFMFFLPNEIVSFYETISKFGSGLFLLVQVILLLDFVHGWNENWVSKDEQFWYVALFVVSLVCYVATFSFSGLLFHWFTPSGHDCGLNTFFIVMTLILVFIFAIVALHPAVNGSLLPASVISLYCTYLCYSGLSSEPRDYECNGLHNHSKAVSTGSLTLGLLTTVLSVVYSAVRAGSSTTLLSPPSSPRAGSAKPLLPLDQKDQQEDRKKDEPRAVTYSYSFFHLIFSLASMYSAMLLTGWSTSVGESGKLVDVGWPSVWVRIMTGYATAALYIWSMVAPFLFPEREF